LALGAHTESPEELLHHADMAMYEAKGRGKGGLSVFEPAMREQDRHRTRLRADLRQAVARDEITLHYQPIVDLRSGEVEGFEALARWPHPELGHIPPDAFIPLAEGGGMILRLGRQLLERACRQVQEWQVGHPRPLDLAVNLSAAQLADRGLTDDVRAVLRDSGLDPRRLVLEITETVLIRDAARAEEALRSLRALGVRIAIDDFGTGYASLGYLRRYPVDILKIDRSFVQELDDPGNAALAAGIVHLGRRAWDARRRRGHRNAGGPTGGHGHGLHCGQGYLFSRPLPPEDAHRFLLEHGSPTPAHSGAIAVAEAFGSHIG
jgi:predicted signal transduction protein with EAL and GGDEF domain